MASRFLVMSIFGLVGFAIGFLAFLASPSVAKAFAEMVPQIVLDPSLVFATISGAAGAIVSTTALTIWARRA